MLSESRVIALLKLFLVGLFGLFTVLQTMSFPGQFAYLAQENPNDAVFRWPATFAVGFIFLCAQIVIVSIWKLLNLIPDDQIFTGHALPWFNRIIGSIVAAGVVPFGFLIFLFIYGDDPGLPMVIITFLTILGVLALVALLLKHRTQKAIELLTK